MFDAGTTLENQMQQSVSTLTVSRIYKSKEIWPRRNLSRQMTLRSLERKVGNLYLCVLGEKWQAGKNESKKEITVGKSKRSKQGQNLSCRTVSESGVFCEFSFSFLESNLFRCENSLWVPLKLQISAMPGGGLIKCCRSSHLAQI